MNEQIAARGRVALVAAVLGGLVLPPAADAVVVCQNVKKTKKIRLREVCKKNEQQVQLTGNEIDESTLDKVPAAATADSASTAALADDATMLGGMTASQFQPAARWANVAADGTIVSQSGGITVKLGESSGQYLVDFGSPVADRPIIVSSGLAGDNLFLHGTVTGGPCTAPQGTDRCTLAIADLTNLANHVFVVTTDTSNTILAPYAFYVMVF